MNTFFSIFLLLINLGVVFAQNDATRVTSPQRKLEDPVDLNADTVIRCQQIHSAAANPRRPKTRTPYPNRFLVLPPAVPTKAMVKRLGPAREFAFGGESRVYELVDHPDQLLILPLRSDHIPRANETYANAMTIWNALKELPSSQHIMEVISFVPSELLTPPYLLVKKAEQGSLRDVIAAQKSPELFGESIQETQVLEQLLGLAKALDTIHSLGWVHGDIKPANILIDQKGTFKIGDLSSCQRELEEGSVSSPLYIDPKEKDSRRQKRNDVFGLSRVVYELAIGQTLNTMADAQTPSTSPLTSKVYWTDSPKTPLSRLHIVASPIEINPKASPVMSQLAMDLAKQTTMSGAIKLIEASLLSLRQAGQKTQ